MADTPLQAARRRAMALVNERTSNGWDSHYRELAENISPWKSRFMASDRNKSMASRRGSNLLTGVARKANRTLSAGLMSGLTNPARPWFKLETFDNDLLEFEPVKIWLERYEYVMGTILQRSNFYQSLPNMYGELGAFGMGAMSIMEDFEDVILTNIFTVGEYAVGYDDRGKCNAFTREYETTVENVVKKFGYKACTQTTREAYDRGDYDNVVTCYHLMEANHDESVWLGMGNNRPFRNLYWEKGALETKELKEVFLSTNGMHEMGIVAPRWDTNSGDTYASNFPGQDALADIKQAHVMEKRKLNKLEKHNNPSMKGPASLRNERTSSLPGDMTYVPDNANTKYEPSYTVDGNIRELREEIEGKKREIEEYFYVPIFQALMNDGRNQRATAREIAELHEEKLLAMGPVLNRLNYEGFDPMIMRVSRIMERASAQGKLLPPPPPELKGTPISVRYVSILAQAQRLVDVQAIDRTATFVTTLGAAFPAALDRFDYDNAIDNYQEITGAPVGIVVPLAKANAARAARQKAEMAQQQVALGAQGVETAKQLSETSTQGSNALTDILGL